MAKLRTPLHLLPRPLSEGDCETYRPALADLQGNILKGHGRDNSVHVFLGFHAGKQGPVKRWLASLAAQVSSMARQREEQREYSKYKIPGSLFCAVYLSAAGYRALGFDVRKFDLRFQAGMKRSRAALADPPVKSWEKAYQGDVHAMILLADDDETYIGRATRELVDQIKAGKCSRILTIERGTAYRNRDDHTVEHFGYVDGASQPLMLQADIQKELKREGLKKFAKWDPSAGPNLVLAPDPLGGENAFGSYIVYRKLEQNVRDFKRREKELATALGLLGPQGELGGAMSVGRFENGKPVVLDDQDELGPGNIVPNDFNFKADSKGDKCPFHSHIRKTNPRGAGLEPFASERAHRIARRGITYGDRTRESFENEDLMPNTGVGLLFMCFQADIANQFAFMQTTWANNAGFPKPKTGLDPVIGQGRNGAQHWPTKWGNPKPALREAFDFSGFVNMKGGEYFFAPSLSFLTDLGK